MMMASFVAACAISGFKDDVLFSLGGGVLVWILVGFLLPPSTAIWVQLLSMQRARGNVCVLLYVTGHLICATANVNLNLVSDPYEN